MNQHLAYCSACDREVEVILKPGYSPGRGEPIPADALLCLAHGDACTGALCPLFGVPPAAMKEKRERTGPVAGGGDGMKASAGSRSRQRKRERSV